MPGREPGEPIPQRVHGGYEWVYVLSGTLHLTLAGVTTVVEVGQAAEFDTRVPYGLASGTGEPVAILGLFSPQGEQIHIRDAREAGAPASAGPAGSAGARSDGAERVAHGPRERRRSHRRAHCSLRLTRLGPRRASTTSPMRPSSRASSGAPIASSSHIRRRADRNAHILAASRPLFLEEGAERTAPGAPRQDGGAHRSGRPTTTTKESRMPGGWEWLIIIAVVMLLFGVKRLPEMARSVGQSARVFKGEMKGLREDEARSAPAPQAQAPAALPAAPTTIPATAPVVEQPVRDAGRIV